MDSKNRTLYSEGFHLQELLPILKLRKKLLITFTVLALLGTSFRQIFYVSMFAAQTTLTIQKADTVPMQMVLSGYAPVYDSVDRLKKYTDYIQSDDFFLAVAQTLKFKEGYNLLNLTSPSELSLTRRKFWQEFFNNSFGHKPAAGSLSSAPEPVLVPIEKLASILHGMTNAQVSGQETIKVFVTTLDAFTSMVLANTVAEVFVRKTTERDHNEVSEVRRFIENQLDLTTDRLKRSETTLVDYKKRHNIISLSSDQSHVSTKVSSIESELENSRLKFQENQKLIEHYEKLLARNETRFLAKGSAGLQRSNAEMVQRFRQQVDSLRNKKVLMQAQGFSETSWQMAEVNRELDKVAAQLKVQLEEGKDVAPIEDEDVGINLEFTRAKLKSLQAENRNLDLKLGAIEKSRNDTLKSLEGLPREEQILLTFKRDVDLQFDLYSTLKKKLQEIEIQQVSLQSRVMVSDHSDLPSAIPRTNFILKLFFAVLVGTFLGSITALVLEVIDPTIKHISELEQQDLTVIGTIPHVDGSVARNTLGLFSYRPDLLICKDRPESHESMAFKHIRAQILSHRSPDGSKVKVLTVTSPDRGEGKTFIASNLAFSLAQLEKRTLLVDCDMRNPGIPWYFGYKEGDGLSSLLTLKSTLEKCVIKNREPYLDILPAGWIPANPSELVSNEKFRILIEHLRSQYEYIILDSPAAATIVDAAVLSSLSDSVILSASYRKTRKDMTHIALKKILQICNRPIYAVLNNAWEGDSDNYHAYVTPIRDKISGAEEALDAKSELEHFEKNLGKKVG